MIGPEAERNRQRGDVDETSGKRKFHKRAKQKKSKEKEKRQRKEKKIRNTRQEVAEWFPVNKKKAKAKKNKTK